MEWESEEGGGGTQGEQAAQNTTQGSVLSESESRHDDHHHEEDGGDEGRHHGAAGPLAEVVELQADGHPVGPLVPVVGEVHDRCRGGRRRRRQRHHDLRWRREDREMKETDGAPGGRIGGLARGLTVSKMMRRTLGPAGRGRTIPKSEQGMEMRRYPPATAFPITKNLQVHEDGGFTAPRLCKSMEVRLQRRSTHVKAGKSSNSAWNSNSSVKKGRVSSAVPMRIAAVRQAPRAKILRRRSKQKTPLFHPPFALVFDMKLANGAAALAAPGAGGGGGTAAGAFPLASASAAAVAAASMLTTVAEPSAAMVARELPTTMERPL